MNKVPLSAEKILAEALVHGIVVLNVKGDIQWSNAQAKALLKLKNNQETIFDVIPDERFSEFFHKAELDMLELYAPSNKNIRLSIYLRPYLHDQQILIIQDITHRYRLENMRQAFIANVSHELRTPLTVFRGYLEILLDQPDLSREQQQKILNQMAGQDHRMERLVQDLLLLSRLESVVPDVEKHEPVNVAQLIRQIHQDAVALSKDQKHQFHVEVDEQLTLMGEPHELHSAFSNLVFNAVRYTPEGGEIFIRWYKDETGAHFEVRDTGVGIAKKHLSLVTQRFYRVDKARSREQGGTGLGLAIVKHVLLRHRGDLVVESELGEGSTFRCNFTA